MIFRYFCLAKMIKWTIIIVQILFFNLFNIFYILQINNYDQDIVHQISKVEDEIKQNLKKVGAKKRKTETCSLEY